MALILGIGCGKKETAPTPEVMALYGGPPVEIRELEPQIEDTGSTEEPADTPPTENVEQSEETQNTDDTESDEDSTKNKPEPIKPTIKPMYGVDATPFKTKK